MIDYFRGFRVPSKFAENYLFHMTLLGHLKTQGARQVDTMRRNVPGNIIMHVVSGTLHVVHGEHYVVSEKQTVLFRHRAPHAYYNIDECELLWMHFDGRQCEIFLEAIERQSGFPFIFESPRIPDLMRDCMSLCGNYEKDSEFMISEAIYKIFMATISSAKDDSASLYEDARAVFTSRALTYIQENIYSRITLTDFADAFHLSASHFSRQFQKYFGNAPLQFVLSQKLNYSKHYLVYTNYSVGEIAATLSFADQSHFTNLFTRAFGLSPNRYRKNAQDVMNK